MRHGLLGNAQFLGQVGLSEAQRLAPLGDLAAELPNKGARVNFRFNRKFTLAPLFSSADLGLLYPAGQAIGAHAANIEGIVTGNQALQDVAIEGMRENVTVSDGINAATMAVSTRGAPGKAGAGLSPRAAAREAMRQEGIPTSQQASSQSSPRGPGNKPAGRERVYDTPNGQKRLQHQLQDKDHGPHWEAGRAKSGGQTDPVGRPRLTNDKKKVDE